MNVWGLVSEDGINLSLGRASFWVLLSVSMYYWFRFEPKDFPPTLLTVLEYNLAYNFGKKGLEVISSATTAITNAITSKTTK